MSDHFDVPEREYCCIRNTPYQSRMNANTVGIVLLSYDYENEQGGGIRSSAHVVEKQGNR